MKKLLFFALPGVVLYILFITLQEPLLRLVTLLFAFNVVAPIWFYALRIWLIQQVKNSKKPNKKKAQEKKAVDLQQYQTIKEIYKDEREQYYLQARDLFKNLMQQGQMSREDIIFLRNLVEDCLGEYVHDFDGYTHKETIKGKEVVKKGFSNDAHRIYIYFKSYHLTEQDWGKIIDFLKSTKEESVCN